MANTFKVLIIFAIALFSGCDTAKKEESNATSDSVLVDNNAGNAGTNIGLKVGQQAPDISLPNKEGKLMTLSSLRGKYILLDFWASWCGPCRYENPNVVRLFQQYKDKDFDILSVSLDNNQQAWFSAIDADGMVWNHVSDLKKWESAVIPVYQLDAIPMTYLLDKNGIIIGKNLRGEDLESKLASVIATK